MFYVTVLYIDAVVKLNRLIPVVWGGFIGKTIVPGDFCRRLPVGYVRHFLYRELNFQLLTRKVIKVVAGRKSHRSVVVATKFVNSLRTVNRFVVPCQVIRHKINDYLHPGTMDTFNQRFKFAHPAVHVHRQIRINIVNVPHGVRRPGIAFNDFRIFTGNAVLGVIRC
ncbi:hypothetical protein SDC9_147177 [bioreactor metagenome]|uniref:Uncharacterized protein n=1 Tax=bioreactor metagenome TaxID=1076179 RepID=A0A645EHB6_9ZZZZ